MCSICLEDFKVGDKLRILHCSHGQTMIPSLSSHLWFDDNVDDVTLTPFSSQSAECFFLVSAPRICTG